MAGGRVVESLGNWLTMLALSIHIPAASVLTSPAKRASPLPLRVDGRASSTRALFTRQPSVVSTTIQTQGRVWRRGPIESCHVWLTIETSHAATEMHNPCSPRPREYLQHFIPLRLYMRKHHPPRRYEHLSKGPRANSWLSSQD
jgi:hypothetical protein